MMQSLCYELISRLFKASFPSWKSIGKRIKANWNALHSFSSYSKRNLCRRFLRINVRSSCSFEGAQSWWIITCIFHILESSSNESLLPNSSMIPFIRSQYWAWSMFPTAQKERKREIEIIYLFYSFLNFKKLTLTSKTLKKFRN